VTYVKKNVTEVDRREGLDVPKKRLRGGGAHKGDVECHCTAGKNSREQWRRGESAYFLGYGRVAKVKERSEGNSGGSRRLF